jgi:signal transduction histidine kinase
MNNMLGRIKGMFREPSIPDKSFIEQRKAKVLHAMVMFTMAVCVFFMGLNTYYQIFTSVLINFLTFVFVMPAFILNKKGKLAGATTYFIFFVMVAVVGTALVAYKQQRFTETENVLFPMLVLSVMMLSGALRWVISAMLMLTIMAMKYIRLDYLGLEADGTFVLLEVNLLVIGLAITFLTYIFAYTLEKSLAQKDQAEKELRNANRTKDKLFSAIAHDIRSPISLFETVLNLDKEKLLDEEDFVRYKDLLRGRLKSLNYTLDNILNWARSQLDGINAYPQAVDFNEIVKENIDVYKQLAEQKSIVFKDKLEKNVIGWIDENHIRLVVRNLVHNALKFSPASCTILLETYTANGNAIFRISDEGTGVSEELMEKMNKGEIVGSTPGTGGEVGSGLGLSLCRELLSKNQGKLTVNNMKPKGAAFTVLVPREPLVKPVVV